MPLIEHQFKNINQVALKQNYLLVNIPFGEGVNFEDVVIAWVGVVFTVVGVIFDVIVDVVVDVGGNVYVW